MTDGELLGFSVSTGGAVSLQVEGMGTVKVANEEARDAFLKTLGDIRAIDPRDIAAGAEFVCVRNSGRIKFIRVMKGIQ